MEGTASDAQAKIENGKAKSDSSENTSPDARAAETRVRLLDIDPTTTDADIGPTDIVTRLQTVVGGAKLSEDRR